ncbi:hypothetical protein A9Q84_13825 [Halobacteriovorax marinus]|uniref:Secreted protein n=1 Tax=Halobacteriovorax marinus TaxID=97084 RepID=A0A1Y5FEI5_9BACT|nr:hypothetical protein A9Q84_13825 [Halobacteriovorax marinus]
MNKIKLFTIATSAVFSLSTFALGISNPTYLNNKGVVKSYDYNVNGKVTFKDGACVMLRSKKQILSEGTPVNEDSGYNSALCETLNNVEATVANTQCRSQALSTYKKNMNRNNFHAKTAKLNSIIERKAEGVFITCMAAKRISANIALKHLLVDTDADGVIDSEDQCLDELKTLAGVDETGCAAIDADGDGIPESVDWNDNLESKAVRTVSQAGPSSGELYYQSQGGPVSLIYNQDTEVFTINNNSNGHFRLAITIVYHVFYPEYPGVKYIGSSSLTVDTDGEYKLKLEDNKKLRDGEVRFVPVITSLVETQIYK